MAWQRITRALELRAQVETALLADQIKVPTNLPRRNAGLPNYADGGDGSAPSGVTPINTPAALEVAMQLLIAKGVVGRTVLMLPTNKVTFSITTHAESAKNIEAQITDQTLNVWAGAASVYLTDLGQVQIVIDRYLDQTLDASFVMDDRSVRIAQLPGRVFADEKLDPSGDAKQRMVIWEGTLEVGSSSAVAALGTIV